jgi:hypothetical protein
MHILTNAWKLLLSSTILLHSMFLRMKIQWQMIWHGEHQVSEQIEENSVSRKTGCFGLTNRTVQFLVGAQCNDLFY